MDISLVKTRGYMALIGDSIDRMAVQDILVPKQKTPYHVTLFTKDELRSLDARAEDLLETTTIETPFDLGLGKSGNIYFKVLFWPQGDMFRRQHNLQTKQFHVTLSSTDDHEVDKGINSIIQPSNLKPGQVEGVVSCSLEAFKDRATRCFALDVVKFLAQHHVASMTDKAFDGAWRLLSKAGNKSASTELASAYVSSHPESIAANMRLADSDNVEEDAKRAMHLYARAAHLALQSPTSSQEIVSLCIKGIIKCSQYTEFGTFFQVNEVEVLKTNWSLFRETGEVFRNTDLQRLVQDEFAAQMELDTVETLLPRLLSLPSNVRIFSIDNKKLYQLPRFFRWLVPFRLALMTTPRSKEDITVLAAHNFRLIVTLTEEEPLPPEWFADSPCRNAFVPVRNYCPPSNQQVLKIIRMIEELPVGEAALVHCGGGKGRAGTVAACYLMARGFRSSQPGDNSKERSQVFPADSMRLLRHLRPGSIETVEQENFVKKFARELASGTLEDRSTEDSIRVVQHPLQLAGTLPSNPSIIVCCGVPGSGKSTFSEALAKHRGYIIVSQDVLGSRAACLSALGNALHAGSRVLVDRCNPYVEDREDWLSYAFHPRDALCVWFDVDRELCIRRADARVNHPTIAQGRAKKVIMSFSKTLVQPSLKEKFACIARVPSDEASSDLLIRLGIPANHPIQDTPSSTMDPAQGYTTPEKRFIYKFPRTRHLFNLGSVARDDLLLSLSDAIAFLYPSDSSVTIVLEEKVDGANLGITLDPESPSSFKVQNRSHYITAKSHAQFKKLDKWLADHCEGLRKILQDSPGRYLLYGEWLYAKHSLHYTRLPDLFLAFDLLDTETSTFLSREALGERLLDTGIHQVPCIPVPETLSEESLSELVRSQPSNFYDGVTEGLYLRREKDGETIDRAKIVRSDFIAGNEHWNRGTIVPNAVLSEWFS